MKQTIQRLSVVLVALVASVATFAYDACVDGIYYNLNSSAKTAEVTYRFYQSYSNENYYKGKVVIPESVIYNGDTYSVTSIDDYAFNPCGGLTSVTIPNSVTNIGDWAFSYCSGLTSVTIPNSVTSIGEMAFYECTGLTSVTIPNSVTSIGNSAFFQCSVLTSITIGNSVTSIGEHAFSYCPGLTSVTIPNSVTSIGNYAFYYCSILADVTIQDAATSIGYSAFGNCTKLSALSLGSKVTSIEGSAFKSCSGLTSVTIPSSVNTIGYQAFDGCSTLTNVTIETETMLNYKTEMFGSNQSSMTLRVPSTLVSSYKADNNWKNFGLIRCISHTLSLVNATEATCTTEGIMSHYHCDYCGNYSDADSTIYMDHVDVLRSPHDLSHHEFKAASCADGNTEYWECTTCHKYFSDANATTEITDKSSVILAATGEHKFDQNDNTRAICTVCNHGFII